VLYVVHQKLEQEKNTFGLVLTVMGESPTLSNALKRGEQRILAQRKSF